MATRIPPGYRSAIEYSFDEEQADAIVRTTAYHRRDSSLSVIWYPPREHDDIRQSIASPFHRKSNAGLGYLDQLPLELLFDTLYHLDVQSLFKFRQICLRSRRVVDSLSQYQRVVLYGLNLYCALLRTRLASNVSLLEFDNALCMKTCVLCAEFGEFIFLPTWRRCCLKCLQRSPETQVRTLASVRKRLNMTKPELNRLTSFKCLPGIYSMEETSQKSCVSLVSLHQATLICKRQPHPPTQAQSSGLDPYQKFNFMGSCALPYYDKQTDTVERGISCAGCQLAIEKDIINTRWGFEARDKVHSRDGFLDHFRWCEQAQLLWKSSCEGRNKPPELPRLARTGGCFQRAGLTIT